MHIAVSGRLGSGKSTVCKILKDKYGFEVYSTGKIQRGIAEKMGITTLELNKRMAEDPRLDHEIDDATREISIARKDENLLFDSRMAWHFAVNAFKVYMYVDPRVAAERVIGDDRGSVEKYRDADDAMEQLRARSEEENRRYHDIYGVDNFDYRNYDIIVDSTTATPGEIAALIYEQYKEFSENGSSGTLMFLSPKSVTVGEDAEEAGDIAVIAKGGKHILVSGREQFDLMLTDGADLIEAFLAGYSR